MSTEFRELNEHERGVILAAAKKHRVRPEDPRVEGIERLRVAYEKMQGGFCVCSLLAGKRLYLGASRRSYKDPRKPIKGELLAFSRAVLYSRSTTLPA